MSQYERLDDVPRDVEGNPTGEPIIPINDDDHAYNGGPVRKKKVACMSGSFCAGSLAGCMLAVLVCSVAFAGVGYAYVTYIQDNNGGGGGSGMVSKNQVKEGGTGKIFDTKVSFNEVEHSLVGVGRREKKVAVVNIKVYAVGLYLHTEKGQAALLPWKDASPDQLRNDAKFYKALRNQEIPRTVRIIMSTNMVNKAKMQEGLKEALVPAIKNHVTEGDPDAVADAKGHKFAELFDHDPKENYVYDFYCDEKGKLYPTINKKVKDPMDEPLICAGFTDIYIGEHSVAPTLKDDVAGRLSILYDEGDNADVEDPTSKIKFKETLKQTPDGQDQPEELKIAGTASMFPTGLSLLKVDLAVAAYTNWYEAEAHLTEKFAGLKKEDLGTRTDFRDAIAQGEFGRAVVARVVQNDFTKSEFTKGQFDAVKKSMEALGVSADNANTDSAAFQAVYNDVPDKIPANSNFVFYCDKTNHLVVTISGATEEAIKEKITLADPKSCSAVIDAWIGSHSHLPYRSIRQFEWGKLFREVTWEQEPIVVEDAASFAYVSKTNSNTYVQILGGVSQIIPKLRLRFIDSHSAVALYVEAAAANGELKDLAKVKPEDLKSTDNMSKILDGKFAHVIEWVQIGYRLTVGETKFIMHEDAGVNALKRFYGDDTAQIDAAKSDLHKVTRWTTKAGDRVRVECDADFKARATLTLADGTKKSEATSDIPEVCKALLTANIAENPHLKSPLPDPEVFYGLWTVDK